MSARYVPFLQRSASGVVVGRGQDSPQDQRTREIVREELALALASLRRDIARELAGIALNLGRLVRHAVNFPDTRVDLPAPKPTRRKRGGGR